MDIREIKEKTGQYCQLWELYAEASCELTRKSKLSQEEARACKVYGLYIRDVLQQVDAAMTIFVMEKQLRSLKGRGHFPLLTITPHSTRIKNPYQIRKTLEALDEEIAHILTTVRESERNYGKAKEEARVREQARTTRSSQRPEYNFLSLNSGTLIKNTGTTENQNRHTERSIHFNPNPIQHLYPTTGTTSHNSQYKPPANDSIIKGADTAPGGQFTANTTSATGHSEAWRNNNRANAPTHTTFPPHTTRPTGCNGFFNDSTNSPNNRNTPMCFRCSEQGHMRHECKIGRVFCNYCKSNSHSNRVCRKLTNGTPTQLTATSSRDTIQQPPHHPYQEMHQTKKLTPQHNPNQQAQLTMDFDSRTTKTQTNREPVPWCTHPHEQYVTSILNQRNRSNHTVSHACRQ